jgi:drug/metabolite transporter (DMT)-like permease
LIPKNIPLPAALYLLSSGFVGFFLADLFIFRAFVDLGPRETMVIMTLSPIFSAVISWFVLGEHLSVIQVTGVLATVLGVMWVTRVEGKAGRVKTGNVKAGILFALLGALTQALAFILAKQGLVYDVFPVTGNMLRVSAGLGGVVAFTLVTGRFIEDFRNMRDRKALLLISEGALVGPVLGMIMSLYALSLAPVGIVTTIMQISPIILLPVDRFIFKKQIPSGAVAGTFLAVGGAALLFLFP